MPRTGARPSTPRTPAHSAASSRGSSSVAPGSDAEALLRQPHGFEGFGSVSADPPPHDLAVAQGGDRHIVRLDLDPVSPPHMRSVKHDHVVAMFDELFWHGDYAVERLEEGVPEALGRLASAIDACLHPSGP